MKKDAFDTQIPTIERLIGYTFRDKSLLRQAFTRTSWCNERGGSYQSNEVLEFFGDGVLSLSIISLLLAECTERYVHGLRTALTEGDFSVIKSRLSDKTNLSRSTAKLGLQRFLLLGEGDVKLGIENEPSVMEDLFESIIGAVYIDSERNMSTVTRVVNGMLDMSVYTSGNAPKQSAKNALQEWCADKRRRLPPPEYKTVSESGPDHRKVYERAVYIGGRLIASAKGKNQKTADAGAAELALEILLREEAEQNAPRTASAAEAPTRAKKKAENAKGSAVKSPVPKSPEKAAAPKACADSARRKPKSKKDTEEKETPTDEPKARRSSPSAQGKRAPKKLPTPDTKDATSRLRKYASGRGVASPKYRDLGTVTAAGGRVIYKIECSFMGKSAVGEADSRLAARELSSALILRELKQK